MIIPLRTNTPIRRTPFANYAIIAANLLVFLVLNVIDSDSQSLDDLKNDVLPLDGGTPRWWQYISYQFVHEGIVHLGGNMLFLWVFGNSVNSKFGNLSYGLFYLSAGIFAGWGFTLSHDNPLMGASGSIAAITTTFMVLFPRSKILFLFFFILITVFELPCLWVILFKVVLWDNVLAPYLIGGGSEVAYGVHLLGYGYGFAATLALQLFGAVARDQFDLLAVLKRWNQRRAFSSAMSDPQAQARAKYGKVARPIVLDADQRREVEARLDRIAELRAKIHDALAAPTGSAAAVDYYEQLTQLDPEQGLPKQQQLAIARLLYSSKKYPQAAGAFEMYLKQFPKDRENNETRLLVGIIYARDLEQYEAAEGHLKLALDSLIDDSRKQQCQQWLDRVTALLRPASPDAG